MSEDAHDADWICKGCGRDKTFCCCIHFHSDLPLVDHGLPVYAEEILNRVNNYSDELLGDARLEIEELERIYNLPSNLTM